MSKHIILTFFKHFPKFAPLPLLNFAVDLKFDHIPLCILSKSRGGGTPILGHIRDVRPEWVSFPGQKPADGCKFLTKNLRMGHNFDIISPANGWFFSKFNKTYCSLSISIVNSLRMGLVHLLYSADGSISNPVATHPRTYGVEVPPPPPPPPPGSKLHYAKFGVCNLFFSKVIEEKPLGVGSTPPPLVQEGLKNCRLGRYLMLISWIGTV